MGVANALRDVLDRISTQADEPYDDAEAYQHAMYDQERSRAARLTGGPAGDDFDDIYVGGAAHPVHETRQLHLVSPPLLDFALFAPRTFEEAQQIADAVRRGCCVTIDLQGCDAQLAKRLIDFCSGLAYALEGSLSLVERAILLLTPHQVDLSGGGTGVRAGGFYNQL